MKLTKCPNGHYYDADKFNTCPHCAGAGSKAGGTIGNDDDRTENFYEKGNDFGGSGQGSADVTGRYPTQPMYQNDPSRQATPPYSDFQTSSQPTMPPIAPDPTSDTVSMSIPGMPSWKTQASAPYPDDDDEKTVAYYADLNPTGSFDKNSSLNMPRFGGVDSDMTAPIIPGAGAAREKVEPVVGWLVCIEGSNFGRSFILHAGKNFIGRNQNFDIYLPDDIYISRDIHASIIFEPKQRVFFAQPGDSHALFYLNDNVVLSNVEIHDRDIIEIGHTKLMFVPFCDERFSWDAGKGVEKA